MGYISYGPTTPALIQSQLNGSLNVDAYVWTNFAGELVGSMVLLLMGLGVVASLQLRFKKENVSKIILFGLAWMGAIFVGVLLAYGIGNAYLREIKDASTANNAWAGSYFLNPALVIARMFMATNPKQLAAGNYLPIGDGLILILAEAIGMSLGVLLMYSVYWKLFKNFQDGTEDAKARQAIIKSCFYTSAIKQNVGLSFLAEMLSVFIFYSAILCLGYLMPGPSAISNALICVLIEMVFYGLGGTTGMAMNPMRDLVPRVMYQILPVHNYNNRVGVKADWNYSWVPMVAPIVGTLLALIIMPGFLYN